MFLFTWCLVKDLKRFLNFLKICVANTINYKLLEVQLAYNHDVLLIAPKTKFQIIKKINSTTIIIPLYFIMRSAFLFWYPLSLHIRTYPSFIYQTEFALIYEVFY